MNTEEGSFRVSSDSGSTSPIQPGYRSANNPRLDVLIESVFGVNVELARRYHTWLAQEATVRGLIGPRETPRLWERHILNSAVVGETIGKGLTVVDIGSGAGLPGIPLALVRPDLDVILVEPLLRRTNFLNEVIADLSLENVRVLRGRVEEQSVRKEIGHVDVVTSRAVAPLGKLAGWSLPLLKSGGVMVAMKGTTAREELRRDERLIKKAKGVSPKVIELGKSVLETPTFAVVVKRK